MATPERDGTFIYSQDAEEDAIFPSNILWRGHSILTVEDNENSIPCCSMTPTAEPQDDPDPPSHAQLLAANNVKIVFFGMSVRSYAGLEFTLRTISTQRYDLSAEQEEDVVEYAERFRDQWSASELVELRDWVFPTERGFSYARRNLGRVPASLKLRLQVRHRCSPVVKYIKCNS